MIESPVYPNIISWNTTKRCNLHCKHCYLDSSELTDVSKGELSTEEGLRFLDELAKLAPGAMLVLTGGEPLLRNDIFELASHATDLSLNVVVGSNGTLLDNDKAKKLVKSGVSGIGISLDSLDADKHDHFRGLSGAWENTVQSIETCKNIGLDFQIQTTATRENYKEIPKLINFSSSKGARAFNVFFLVCTGRGEKITDLSQGEYDDLLKYLAENQSNNGNMMIRARCAPHFARFVHQESSNLPIIKACLAGTNYCRITPEGDVTPCPYLPITVGNIREESFERIWNGAGVLKELREQKLKGKCGVCEYTDSCGGCRARAYALTDDIMESDPSCIYKPKQENTVITTDDAPIIWSDEALARLEKVPFFVRDMVKKGVERYCREKGHKEVTPVLMTTLRKRFKNR